MYFFNVFSTFQHNYHNGLNICRKLLQAFVLCIWNVLPVRITSLQLLLSPYHLWQSVCHQETPLSSKTSDNRLEPGSDCTERSQLVPKKCIWSDYGWGSQNASGIVMHKKNSGYVRRHQHLFWIICWNLVRVARSRIYCCTFLHDLD